MPRPFTPLPVRFWRMVQKGEQHQCWLWVGCRDRDGYGSITRGGQHGQMIKAHRAAWELTNGEIPVGLIVMHKCDNPSCVNPDHLMIGTHADNLKDMAAKGRSCRAERHWTRTHPDLIMRGDRWREIMLPKIPGRRVGAVTHPERIPRGERQGSSKLLAPQVVAIRQFFATGTRGNRLARDYGVSVGTISDIVRRKTWKHI